MTDTIVFDDREADLAAAYRAFAARHAAAPVAVSRRLDLGDALVSGTPGATLLVERKAAADLVASAFTPRRRPTEGGAAAADGRLDEQSKRMRAWQAEHPPDAAVWIVLLVEGGTFTGDEDRCPGAAPRGAAAPARGVSSSS